MKSKAKPKSKKLDAVAKELKAHEKLDKKRMGKLKDKAKAKSKMC